MANPPPAVVYPREVPLTLQPPDLPAPAFSYVASQFAPTPLPPPTSCPTPRLSEFIRESLVFQVDYDITYPSSHQPGQDFITID